MRFSFFIFTSLFLAVSAAIFIFPTELAAAVGGQILFVPQTKDQQTIKETTVRLIVKNNHSDWAFCSGVVLSEYEVVTAGHCNRAEFAQGQVFVEFYNKRDPTNPIQIQVASFDFEYTILKDIGLIRLARPGPVKFSLPIALADCDAGSSMISAGFGLRLEKTIDSENRRVVGTSIYRAETLEEPVEAEPGFFTWLQAWLFSVDEGGLVKLKNEKGHVCFGDSGGPVFCRSHGRLALVGINNSMTSDVSSNPLDASLPSQWRLCRDENTLFITAMRKESKLIDHWRRQKSANLVR